jgi:hypothetical protein
MNRPVRRLGGLCVLTAIWPKSPPIVEVPQSVKPDSVFKAVVKVPYDLDTQQVLGDGSKGGLNVGAVLMLPEGFKIAPPDRIPEELKEEVGSTYFLPYSEDQDKFIVLVGPLPGEQYQEIVFPILSPDPAHRIGTLSSVSTRSMWVEIAGAARFIPPVKTPTTTW